VVLNIWRYETRRGEAVGVALDGVLRRGLSISGIQFIHDKSRMVQIQKVSDNACVL